MIGWRWFVFQMASLQGLSLSLSLSLSPSLSLALYLSVCVCVCVCVCDERERREKRKWAGKKKNDEKWLQDRFQACVFQGVLLACIFGRRSVLHVKIDLFVLVRRPSAVVLFITPCLSLPLWFEPIKLEHRLPYNNRHRVHKRWQTTLCIPSPLCLHAGCWF